jgi:hypothetical protein
VNDQCSVFASATHVDPAGSPRGQITRDESALTRALQKLPSSRRSSIEPRKITVKSALRASRAMAQAPLLTLIFHGSFGAYREDGPSMDSRQDLPVELV